MWNILFVCHDVNAPIELRTRRQKRARRRSVSAKDGIARRCGREVGLLIDLGAPEAFVAHSRRRSVQP